MSLSREAFDNAEEQMIIYNNRVNQLFEKFSLPLKDKVQMDHYGKLYLFGVSIEKETTDDELIKIIESTPKESWDGHIDFFGKWIDNSNQV